MSKLIFTNYSIGNILKGWGRKIQDEFGSLKPTIKEMSEERLLICDSCEVRNGNMCSTSKVGKHAETGELTRGCGCHVDAKSMVEEEKCPLNKW